MKNIEKSNKVPDWFKVELPKSWQRLIVITRDVSITGFLLARLQSNSDFMDCQQYCDFFTITKFVFTKMCPPLPKVP